MNKKPESWGASLALRERKIVTALLREAKYPGSWNSGDIVGLTRDLAEIDQTIALHRLRVGPLSLHG